MSKNLLGYTFTLMSAFSFGSAAVIIRWGVREMAPPLVGLTFALLVGTLALTLGSTRSLQDNILGQHRALAFLILAGVASAIGVMSMYTALSLAPAVVVMPLVNANPLVAVWGVHLFLQRWERVTRPLVVGCLLIVLGGVLIVVGGGSY